MKRKLKSHFVDCFMDKALVVNARLSKPPRNIKNRPSSHLAGAAVRFFHLGEVEDGEQQ